MPPYARPVPAVLLAWLLTLGIDLFLHGGLLARLYVVPSPFLLPARDAFARIPLGYVAFLILTAALFWLLRRLDVRGFGDGLRHGLVAGSVIWGSLVLGLYSISTAPTGLLAGWWIGQAVELGFAGGVIAALAAGRPVRRTAWLVGLAIVVLFVLTVALQSLGLAPAMEIAQARS